MSHTPGPWLSDNEVVDWLAGAAPGVAVRYEDTEGRGSWNPVCMVQPHMSGKYSVAGSKNPIEDARLIAAAPELFAACVQVEQRFFGNEDPGLRALYVQVLQAIKKAIGEQP